jgi:formylglycine-generating enzyme required for sulfatase activity
MDPNSGAREIFPAIERRPLSLTVEITRYLREVMAETEHLVFGNPAGFRFDHHLQLQDVWVAQDAVVRDLGDAMTHAPLNERERVSLGDSGALPIEAALNMRLFQRAVVLAPPGYGKTTLCRRLAYKEALDGKVNSRGWIPVRFPASIVNQWGVWSSTEDLLSRTPLIQGQPELHRQLSECGVRGELWVLFDGLDEVAEPYLPELISRLTAEIVASQNRVTITCRVADYEADRPSRHIQGLPVLELSGFTEDRVDFYIENWHQKAGRGRPDWSQSRLSATRGLLEAHSELRELASSPLLAAVVCVVESKLQPALVNRAALLRRAVEYLLVRPEWRTADAKESGIPELDAPLLLELAAGLSYNMLAGSAAAASHPQFSISRGELQRYVKRGLVDLGAYDATDGAELELAAAAYAERLLGRSAAGLLQERRVDSYEFAHRAFQEYLAAQYLASHVQYDDRLRLAKEEAWSEVFILTASIAQASRDGLGELLMLVRALLEGAASGGGDGEKRAHAACLAAEMLAELGENAAKRYGFESAVTGDPSAVGDPSFTGLWSFAVDVVFEIAQSAAVSELTRMRALCVVSRIRDPRFVDRTGALRGDLGVTISVPGGLGYVGTKLPLDMHEAKRVPSSPRRQVSVAEFQMGKRPVTNLEYRAFIESGGYEDPRWWEGDESSKWRAGDERFLAELIGLWEQQKDLNFVKEFSEPDFAVYAKRASAQIARRTMMRRQPLYWRDSRFNLPTAPVVGVNLWEARAYCRWIGDCWRQAGAISPNQFVAVPTEVEWEWAASRQWTGKPRAYPWGDRFDPGCCLVRDFSFPSGTDPRIRHFGAIPVGFFELAKQASADAQDMGGNVWEWVDSLSLPWNSDRAHEVVGGLEKRVVRGGSWFSREPLATHVSFRLDDPPCNAYWDLGFRVVVRSA